MFPIASRAPNHRRVTAQSTAKPKNFPAPRRGWIRNENLAKSKPEGASLLDNWFPTTTGARVRRGKTKLATIGAGTPVGAIMAYVNGVTKKLFAANDTAIYDITAPADPAVSPAASVSGLTSGEISYTMFANSGGNYLVVVNGHDSRQLYDGTSWTSPAITGPTAALAHVWTFKQRQFFIELNTMNAWYLPVDAISGATTVLPLGGVFKLGGSLLFGATWSYGAGSGLNESCVFVTTEGEVAIYEGTDPSSAATWGLKGVYRIGRPLGRRAILKGGGDLAIATDIGLIPLSQAIAVDVAAIGGQAVSAPIEAEWLIEVAQRRSQYFWSIEMWPTQQMAIVAMPTYGTLPAICFVANVRTGAWTRYTGWDTHCVGLYVDRLFFGSIDGKIYEAEVGGSDDGAIYTASYVGLFDELGSPGATKLACMARATFLTISTTAARLSISTDYVVNLPQAPSVGPIPTSPNNWDQGQWNQAMWGDVVTKQREALWQSVAGQGCALAPAIQISIGGTAEPQIDLVEFDLTYEQGQIGS
jgi:hypothetical protein